MLHAPIGIVVNPSSGKDVRRLVARASVFDNREKSAIVRRALVGATNTGAKYFAYMDDSHNIAASAFDELTGSIRATRVSCPKTASSMDTEVAARTLQEAGCIATLILGGDGTSRVFTKGWREAVLLPVSTGTNNVFPRFAEATIAGAVLGLIATGKVPLDDVIEQVKIIDIRIEGDEPDIALIDAVITDEKFVGARALLEGDALRCALLTRAEPAAVGITSIGGLICPVSEKEDCGLLLKLGKGGKRVNAPIAPGLYQKIRVSSAAPVAFGQVIKFEGPCVIALDGERERVVKAGQKFDMRLSRTGPYIIDIEKTMEAGAASGAFTG